jgi:hypothetical protein
MYIWIGDGVSSQILIDLFQVENWDEIGPQMVSVSGDLVIAECSHRFFV